MMSMVLGITTLFIYQYFANNLYDKIDRQIKNLADSAAHSLPTIKANLGISQTSRTFDNDGDLDIPWQDLRQNQQTVEWFSADGKLLVRTGKKIPKFPLVQSSILGKVQKLKINENDQHNLTNTEYEDLRFVTIPVYLSSSLSNQDSSQKVLIGYVRVSESGEEIEEELERLLWALGWGGILAIALSSIGGWWLVKKALQPIERNYEQMRQFTADASHELRSPLTAIKTSVDVIRSHPERIHRDDVQKMAAIAHATAQMGNLVEDLLFMARFDNTKFSEYERHKLLFSLSELLEDVLEILETQIQQKEITLHTNLYDPKLNQINIYGEPHEIRRLLMNLLENAIAYTPKAGDLTVNLLKYEDYLKVSISDTGIGIANEDLDHIFERFWRSDRARTRRSGGSGLGLSIAQAIANRHGTTINVKSEIGVGSSFSVKFFYK
ncbi:two-component sensor histidine kinase [Pseudanabaena sp. FACHB-723]|uniref:histidine kinase n=2 Tax=Pseudanabaena mucicola TaxID=71190 RepID=A0ABR7ZV03_9CYAN|nr:two-component sensor histidine kinase [Pseudanabaena mucicola FACHB-723]